MGPGGATVSGEAAVRVHGGCARPPVADFGVGEVGSLTEPQAKVISGLWNRGVPRTARYSILEKYQLALVEIGRAAFDEGRRPFQDVKLLVGLRNALVHFEPEIQESGSTPENTPRLAERLAGKVPLSPFVSEFDRVFPQRFLSFGAAAWGADAAWQLVAEFNAKLSHSFSPHTLKELDAVRQRADIASRHDAIRTRREASGTKNR